MTDKAPTAKIEMSGVRKAFGRKVVLDGVDLTVHRGESMVIIGGSGTGKSVTIKSILGLIKPDAGEIKVDGQSVLGLTGRARKDYLAKFGMLFQGAALFDSLPVWRNVGFGLINGQGMKPKQAREVAIENLRRVGLTPDVADLRPAELSGGLQKRVGLARALALSPELMLYDEPTPGLDPIMSDVINELMLRTRSSSGVTSLIITHDMRTARKVADRVIMLYPFARLKNGEPQVIFDGPPSQLDKTTDQRVRQFVNGEAGERLMELRRAHLGIDETPRVSDRYAR